MRDTHTIKVIGGGLAGTEAAHQAALLGVRVKLYEMRPARLTPAHQTSELGELVCSNSLKSLSHENASGVLKEEMAMLGSLVIEAALGARVPAGKALAVDRTAFAQYLTASLERNPLVEIVRDEVTALPDASEGPVIIATGPLTSPALTERIIEVTGSAQLYFYDSISPIVDTETIDTTRTFRASRYDTGTVEEGDYLNCPLTRDEYYAFVQELLAAERVGSKDFEKDYYFESCLPVEVIAERGPDTLRYGPMKPVGLRDPRTGASPFAVVQLRMENEGGTMYNLVGFQTKLRYPEQRRIFRMIPGLERAEFLRYGSTHRNTYIHSPTLLDPTLRLKGSPGIFFAGQIVGVEGYVESAAMGIVAGINAALVATGRAPLTYPPESSIGALLNYISNPAHSSFQPMNINFGLYPPIPGKMPKARRRELMARRALEALGGMIAETVSPLMQPSPQGSLPGTDRAV